MRLIKQNIERKTGSGSATLLPEEPEDMVSMSVSCLARCRPTDTDSSDSGTPTTSFAQRISSVHLQSARSSTSPLLAAAPMSAST